MRNWLILGILMGFSSWAFAEEGSEIIELKSGHSIQGEVLKERPNEVIVDLGVDILRISTEDIVRRRPVDQDPEDLTMENGGPKDGFYAVAQHARGTVRELSAKYGEGVVLVQTPSGLGSGFIINDKGYCVTNHHVISGETRISVTIFLQTQEAFQKRRIEDVEIVAMNPFMDLALLKIPKQEEFDFLPLAFPKEDELLVGDPVFAIGNPLGLERSVSEGIISTKNRNFDGLIYLQTTAQINPGNSGGPLFNMRGQVVGVTSMKVGGAEGLGFAIPSTYVEHFLKNRDAFAYDRNNPNNGFHYLDAPKRRTRRQSEPAKSISQTQETISSAEESEEEEE